jgi:sec-independent protein translocase protein TatA
MRIGTQELLLIFLIILVIFGPTQIPKLSKMFGKSMKSFKQGVSGDEAEVDKAETVKKSPGDKESDE